MERRAEDGVVLRRWRMPVIAAIMYATVGPMCIAVLLFYPMWFLGRFLQLDETAFAWSAFGVLYLCSLVCAVRSLLSRVVVGAEGLRVHNVFSTIWIAWSEVEEVKEISFFNFQALTPNGGTWYGTVIRVCGRRRPVRIHASWSHYEHVASDFSQCIRSLDPRLGRQCRLGLDRLRARYP
jgi:hypothetical protein